jgi:hypothetical protein
MRLHGGPVPSLIVRHGCRGGRRGDGDTASRLRQKPKPSLAYEAMLLNCIDPRFSTWTWAYMSSDGWQDLYSQFTIAGGPVAAVVDSKPFSAWQQAWWDNLAIAAPRQACGRPLPSRLRRRRLGLWRKDQDGSGH